MPTSEQEWSYENRIPSDSDHAHQVIEQLMLAMEERDWPGRDMFHVQMALEEAIVNAIEHGNLRDLKKFVAIDFKLLTDRAVIVITDEGIGFDHENLADPTDDDRIDKPRGRGVHLIRNLMTDVLYNEKGNEVRMIKERSQAEEKDAS